MNKKIILLLVLIILVAPILPRIFSPLPSNKTLDLPNTTLLKPKSDSVYSFQKNELMNKAVLFFQTQEAHNVLPQKSYQYYFNDNMVLKIPPVIHTKSNLPKKHFVTVTVKKHYSSDNVDNKKIVCTYEAATGSRFNFNQCSLVAIENETNHVLVQNIFNGGKKRELVVDSTDMLDIAFTRDAEAGSLTEGPIVLEATFDLTLE